MREQRYGLLDTEFNWLFKRQNGRCAICLDELNTNHGLHVDHDHQTGQIRGLLCGRCNRGLGLLRDNPVILEHAATYVRSWEFAQGFMKENI